MGSHCLDVEDSPRTRDTINIQYTHCRTLQLGGFTGAPPPPISVEIWFTFRRPLGAFWRIGVNLGEHEGHIQQTKHKKICNDFNKVMFNEVKKKFDYIGGFEEIISLVWVNI